MKTLKKVLVIVYCVSFIGMTVSPSSAIPCCCKTRASSTVEDALDLDQSTTRIDSCCAGKKAPAHNCCAMHPSTEETCAFTKTTNLNCDHCSCLKHLHLVAISETGTSDRIDRGASVVSILIDTFVTPQTQFLPSFQGPTVSFPAQTFLLHCSLRI